MSHFSLKTGVNAGICPLNAATIGGIPLNMGRRPLASGHKPFKRRDFP